MKLDMLTLILLLAATFSVGLSAGYLICEQEHKSPFPEWMWSEGFR